MHPRVAYQGTEGSFSENAIEFFFGSLSSPIGKITFEDVFKSLSSNEVEFAALPVENSLIGPIVENLDLFAQNEITVVGELYLPIEHCLMGKHGQRLEEIRKVYSHPKALAQCTNFFAAYPQAKPIVHFDTAGAAREVSLQNDLSVAAIGSRRAAELYKLEVIKSHLEDDQSNTTRFLFLKKGEMLTSNIKTGKCSLLFSLNHQPGALSNAIKIFSDYGLNLTQIVSRPIRERPFEYLFFVDIILSGEVDLSSVMEALRATTQSLKLLGVYDSKPPQ